MNNLATETPIIPTLPAEIDGLQIYDRYTGSIRREKVYKEAYLRFVYNNPLGRLALHGFVKRAFFSNLYGRRMNSRASARLISAFIRDYEIDTTEFLESPESFTTFNEFFFRKLKPEVRPVVADPDAVCLPADGRHSAVEDISRTTLLFVKNCAHRLDEFLGSETLARRFVGGSALFSRLAPVDYHRFCFPVAGEVRPPRRIDGALYSVSPIALRKNAAIFVQNRRWVSEIVSDAWGTVAMVEVAATNVGSLEYTSSFGRVEKGGEKGYFKFGGSSVVLLFEPGRIRLSADILEQTRLGREVYAHIGDLAGRRP